MILAYLQNCIGFHFTVNSHENRAARLRRKQLGRWNVPQTWTTLDGRCLQLNEIGDEHLENIIKFLIRNAARDSIRTGKWWTDHVLNAYWGLLEEYEFRGFSSDWVQSYSDKATLVAEQLLGNNNELYT